MSEKIVAIGSNSFYGSNFVDHALQNGAEVIGISRSSEPHPVFLPYRWGAEERLKNFRFCRMDINCDLEKITAVINDFKPDYVVNFASQSMVAESWENPEHWMLTNVVSNVKFHDSLRKSNFIKKYAHISTPEVYGSCKGLVRENTNYNPSTPYAVSRAASDMSLMTFYNNYGFPVVFTRAANIYGPGQQLYRIVPRTILFFLIGRKLQLHGGGHSVRSFIHIRDTVEGTLLVVQKASPGEIYHLSTARNISIRSLVQMIAGQMGVNFEDHVEIIGDRPGKDSAYLLDSTKAREKLGWQDRISLEQGIAETIRWVKDNLEELKKQQFDYMHKP